MLQRQHEAGQQTHCRLAAGVDQHLACLAVRHACPSGMAHTSLWGKAQLQHLALLHAAVSVTEDEATR